MSDRSPLAIDDAVRAALADNEADLTVCLFGSSVLVEADDALVRGLATAADVVSHRASGPVDVTVSVRDTSVDVAITAPESVVFDDDDATGRLDYVRRLIDGYGGMVTTNESGLTVRLLRV